MEAQQHDQPSSTTSSLFLHTSNAQPNQTVHWLPCNIQYDGPANICQYFNPTPDNPADPSVEQAAFRGNLLRGKTLPLPQGTRGLVAQPKDGWQPTAEFSQLTYWNHERVPSHTDAAQRVLEWMSVAAMMHQPVQLDSVQDAMLNTTTPTQQL